MYFINIPKVVTRETTLTDKKTGETKHEQVVLICHPEKMGDIETKVLLKDANKPFPPGRYELGADSIQGGTYGRCDFRLQIGKPIQGNSAKAAA